MITRECKQILDTLNNVFIVGTHINFLILILALLSA